MAQKPSLLETVLAGETFARAVEHLAQDLNAMGVRWAPIKSAAHWRSMARLTWVPSDVDVLVAPEVRLSALVRQFHARGYRKISVGTHAITWAHPEVPHFLFDVHERPDPYGLFRLHPEALFSRAQHKHMYEWQLDAADAACIWLASWTRGRRFHPESRLCIVREFEQMEPTLVSALLCQYGLCTAAKFVGIRQPRGLRACVLQGWFAHTPRSRFDALLEPLWADQWADAQRLLVARAKFIFHM